MKSPENQAGNETPQQHLLAQLQAVIPGEYDADHRQEATLYLGSRRNNLRIINADGRYNVIHEHGRQSDLYWVFKSGAIVARMVASDIPHALEPTWENAAATSEHLSGLIEQGAFERPQTKLAVFAGRLSARP